MYYWSCPHFAFCSQVMTSAVILHAAHSQHAMGDRTLARLCDVVLSQDLWSVYKIARQCLRFAQYKMASLLLAHIKNQVPYIHIYAHVACCKQTA